MSLDRLLNILVPSRFHKLVNSASALSDAMSVAYPITGFAGANTAHEQVFNEFGSGYDVQ
jgi:hypothetical protein